MDLDDINDINKRHALEVQISEFGQVPKQLFKQPHVPRTIEIPEAISINNLSLSREDSVDMNVFLNEDIELVYEFTCHKKSITSLNYNSDSQSVITTSEDGSLKCYDLANKRQSRSVNLGTVPISSCARILDTNTYIIGSWNDSM